jgi:hypothetical protein
VERLSYFAFHFSRADRAEGRMDAVGVVEAFYIGQKVSPGLIFGGIDTMVDAFGFKRVKEALHRCLDAPMSKGWRGEAAKSSRMRGYSSLTK